MSEDTRQLVKIVKEICEENAIDFKAIPHNIGRGRKQGTTKLLPPLAYSDMCGRQPD